MNIEQLLEQHLDSAASQLPSHGGDPSDVRALASRRVRNRRTAWAAVGVAAAALVVVGGSTLLTGTVEESPVATDGTTTTITSGPTTVPVVPPTTTPDSVVEVLENVVVVPSDEGLLVLEVGGAERVIPGDEYFEGIESVVSDGAGGLVFTHQVTPLPWAQGSIMWLRAGASGPVVVADGWEVEEGREVVRDLLAADGDHVVYMDRRFRQSDLEIEIWRGSLTGELPSQLVYALTQEFTNPTVREAAAAGEVVAVLETDVEGCSVVTLFDPAGEMLSQVGTACEFAEILSIDVDASGRLLILFDVAPEGYTVGMVDGLSGELMASVGVGQAWEVRWSGEQTGRVATDDGLVEVNLTDQSAEQVFTTAVAGDFDTAARLELAADARHGSGTGELPCSDVPTQPIDPSTVVPSSVSDRLSTLRGLATACDYEALSFVADRDQTAIALGGEIDLARLWIRGERRGWSPRAEFLEVTALRPASVTWEDGTVVWLWPAVAATEAEADWQELIDVGFMTAEEVAEMREFGYYVGFRTGITEDGRWTFALVGD